MLKTAATALLPSVHMKREEKAGSHVLLKSMKSSYSKTSIFSIPYKNTSHFLEKQESPTSQFQMSRFADAVSEVLNSPTAASSPSSHQVVEIAVSYSCSIQGKAKFGFFFFF